MPLFSFCPSVYNSSIFFVRVSGERGGVHYWCFRLFSFLFFFFIYLLRLCSKIRPYGWFQYLVVCLPSCAWLFFSSGVSLGAVSFRVFRCLEGAWCCHICHS